MTWAAANLAPIMFGSLMFFLLTGFPVAFSLAACGMFFGFLGIEMGLLPVALLQALPLRLIGIMQNDTLLAIPFFTFMGLILERSGMAEDLLDTVGQVFGPLRGGLVIAVILVGAMLAATTGVVAASVISMGLISLPIMLRYGYNREVASGAITASGTLAQIIPPSLVLIVIADQVGKSVGDMYAGAFLPGFMLVGLYVLVIVVLAIFKPSLVPALPPEARIYRQPDGSSGMRSLAVLTVIAVAVGVGFGKNYGEILAWFKGASEVVKPPTDETIVMALSAGVLSAFVLSVLNRVLKANMLSRIAEQVTFVLIPPLALIFLVLGTIFLGVATPTEGGAMGAVGALAMAIGRRKLSMDLMRQALNSTAKLSSFVLFVLVGSTIFSLTFQGIDGPIWVEHLFDKIPGGEFGFLLVVNVTIFILGMFLDFFEIAFILLPLLAPVAEKMGIDLIWFGIMIAMNLQTSFLTPPFGFALFYLRSVAPFNDYTDRVTGKPVAKVTTAQIYRGSVPFVIIQIAMVALVWAYPNLVLDALGPKQKIDVKDIKIEIPVVPEEEEEGDIIPGVNDKATQDKAAGAAAGDARGPAKEDEDPAAALLRQIQRDAAKDAKK
jgi:TRAP-type mannitol/chloroaromatic compound transport system permease large subunit